MKYRYRGHDLEIDLMEEDEDRTYSEEMVFRTVYRVVDGACVLDDYIASPRSKTWEMAELKRKVDCLIESGETYDPAEAPSERSVVRETFARRINEEKMAALQEYADAKRAHDKNKWNDSFTSEPEWVYHARVKSAKRLYEAEDRVDNILKEEKAFLESEQEELLAENARLRAQLERARR